MTRGSPLCKEPQVFDDLVNTDCKSGNCGDEGESPSDASIRSCRRQAPERPHQSRGRIGTDAGTRIRRSRRRRAIRRWSPRRRRLAHRRGQGRGPVGALRKAGNLAKSAGHPTDRTLGDSTGSSRVPAIFFCFKMGTRKRPPGKAWRARSRRCRWTALPPRFPRQSPVNLT
jgi:hypothetical protein